ncbi:MAG: hypothetical protein KFH98_14325 [Gemmatimonadetes bacterium]|nr:hypothetical protein [Gemmatimonadota bacterium]
MNRVHAFTAVALLSVAFVGTLAAQGVPLAAQGVPLAARHSSASPDTVQLRFGWAAGTAAHVETTRRQYTSGVNDTVTGDANYRMRVQRHPEGLIITYDEFEFPAASDTVNDAQIGSLADRAAAIVPRVLVDSAGSFVRVEDVESVRARLDTLVTSMLEPGEAEEAREAMATLVTAESLGGLAAQEWNTIVGRWAGVDLVVGEKYFFEEEAALPMLPGTAITLVSEFSIEGWTPCTEGVVARECVEIRVEARADPAAVQRILAEFTEQITAVPGVGLVFESFEMGNEIVLVTEPATLRPHSVRIRRGLAGVFTADGERSEVSQSEVRTYRYTYMQ